MDKKMSVLNKLAISQGRRDEVPNQELAHELVEKRDTLGIAEIAANLQNKNADILKKAIHEKSREYTNYFFPSQGKKGSPCVEHAK